MISSKTNLKQDIIKSLRHQRKEGIVKAKCGKELY